MWSQATTSGACQSGQVFSRASSHDMVCALIGAAHVKYLTQQAAGDGIQKMKPQPGIGQSLGYLRLADRNPRAYQ